MPRNGRWQRDPARKTAFPAKSLPVTRKTLVAKEDPN